MTLVVVVVSPNNEARLKGYDYKAIENAKTEKCDCFGHVASIKIRGLILRKSKSLNEKGLRS